MTLFQFGELDLSYSAGLQRITLCFQIILVEIHWVLHILLVYWR